MWAAPLQGITEDPIFRTICRESGAELTFVPMIDIGEYCQHPDAGKALFTHTHSEHPFAIQVLGNSKSPIKDFFDRATTFDIGIVDLNLSCAARSALVRNMGGALLRKTGKAAEFTASVIKYCPVPVTAKMRSGWSREENYGIEIARELEKEGIAAITVHGCSVKAKYTVKSNPKYIRQICEAAHVPVIANGDIKTRKDGEQVLETTGAAGVMIGRASIGNPYVFAEIGGSGLHPFVSLSGDIKPLWLFLDYVEVGQDHALGLEFTRAKHFLYVHLKDTVKKQALRGQLDAIQTLEAFLTQFLPKYPALARHPLAKLK